MPLQVERKRNLEFYLKSMFAGGIAGMCAKTTVAPLDRIKILLQAHNKHYKHLGIFSGLKYIVKRETFFALYKGNGAQMVRIFPYAAIQFMAYEHYKKSLLSILDWDADIIRFLAGSGAGVTAATLTYPLDAIRARLAFQVTGEHVYTGIAHAAKTIFKEEGGFLALYRGFLPTVCGMAPYAGSAFFGFEKLKLFCMKNYPEVSCDSCSRNSGGLVLTLPANLLCGGLSGGVAQIVSYPFDVTRRRMQLAMMNPETKRFGRGMWSTVKLIYKENGVFRGFYRGLSINYLRAVPMQAVSFTTYELMKQMLDLDTGMSV